MKSCFFQRYHQNTQSDCIPFFCAGVKFCQFYHTHLFHFQRDNFFLRFPLQVRNMRPDRPQVSARLFDKFLALECRLLQLKKCFFLICASLL